jgi:hypothetical protein
VLFFEKLGTGVEKIYSSIIAKIKYKLIIIHSFFLLTFKFYTSHLVESRERKLLFDGFTVVNVGSSFQKIA